MDLLQDPAYFRCEPMSATIKKRYCVGLQDRLAEAVMSRSPDAKHLLNDEIKLSRCRNCPVGWRNRKELEKMDEPKKTCSKCGEEKPLEEGFRKVKARKDGHAGVCRECVRKREKAWAAKRKLEKDAPAKGTSRMKPAKKPAAPVVPAPARSFLAKMVGDVVHAAEQSQEKGEMKDLIEAAYPASLNLTVKLRALMEKM